MTGERGKNSARDLIDTALLAVRDGLRDFFDRLARAGLGSTWFASESKRAEALRDTDDVHVLLSEMTKERPQGTRDGDDPTRRLLRTVWFDEATAPEAELGRLLDTEAHRRRNNAHELIFWRNRWAHHQPLSYEDAYRAIDCAERMLKAIDDDRRAEAVRNLRSEALEALTPTIGRFSHRFVPKPIAAGTTAIAISWQDPRPRQLPSTLRFAVVRDGFLVDHGAGSPDEVGRLVDLHQDASPDGMIVGLACALSAPSWYFGGSGPKKPEDHWRRIDSIVRSAESFKDLARALEPPWWGVGLDNDEPPEADARLRATEDAVQGIVATKPESAFELTGTGNVATLALAGIPILVALRERGFTVWPFESVSDRTVVETFPRALGLHLHPLPRGADTRSRFIRSPEAHDLGIGSAVAREMEGDVRLLDAVMTAWALATYGGGLADLALVDPKRCAVEGQIWLPE